MSYLNPKLLELEIYASKAIALEAKKNPDIANLSFGEPEFGPPNYLLKEIEQKDLSLETFLNAVKRYEEPLGDLTLRESIANWYKSRYGIMIDPHKEIMITHGAVEAITLAILCTSEPGEQIAITDPSYMLYERAIKTLDRIPISIKRSHDDYEYKKILNDPVKLSQLHHAKTIIINSPENPSGYVLDKTEWDVISGYSQENKKWIIHDEVYDTMAFERQHQPQPRSPYSIIVNSFSKKFGIPGLRIGWIVAPEKLIELASKIHDYIYLGVNIQYEKIATRLLSDHRNIDWVDNNTKKIHLRVQTALEILSEDKGYTWPRKPLGAMFLFPNVKKLYEKLPEIYKNKALSVGENVAHYLMQEKKVAVVPGSVYGANSSEHIRLVLCSSDQVFDLAMQRLAEQI